MGGLILDINLDTNVDMNKKVLNSPSCATAADWRTYPGVYSALARSAISGELRRHRLPRFVAVLLSLDFARSAQYLAEVGGRALL